MTYEIDFTDKLLSILAKLKKRNAKDFWNVRRKIDEICDNPEHYKSLCGDMKGQRRVHLNTHFVLTYEISGNTTVFLDYEHHDRVYEKGAH